MAVSPTEKLHRPNGLRLWVNYLKCWGNSEQIVAGLVKPKQVF